MCLFILVGSVAFASSWGDDCCLVGVALRLVGGGFLLIRC